MKKNYYFGLALIIFVLTLSGCGQKATTENKLETGAKNVEQNTAVGGEEEISASAVEMLSKGKSLHCTFDYANEADGSRQSGDFYLDGQNKKFRTDAAVVTGDKTLEVKTISDGQYAYSWNSLDIKNGFKIKLDQKVTATSTTGQKTQDLNNPIKFKCQSWKVDNSLFELPQGVQFNDLSEMMKSVTPAGGAGGIDLCGICGQIPDAQQKALCQKTNCK